MRSRLFLLFSMLLITATSFSQKKDDKKKTGTETGVFNGGVVYSLPRTGIRIYVDVTQERYFRGPYADYASKYLGIKGSSSSDGETWKITGIKMETFGEPDPNEVHKAKGAVSSLLSLSGNGTLLGINCTVKGEPEKSPSTDFTPSMEMPHEIWPDLSMHSFISGKDSTHIGNDKFKTFEEKAAEAAKDIIKMRKKKAMVLAAKNEKVQPDGQAYQVMVDELRKAISDYESLFIGKSIKLTHNYVFEVVPETKGNKAIVAFRFSTATGVFPESNVSAKAVMLEIDPNNELSKNAETAAASTSGETNSTGLFYRTPGQVVARLLSGSDVLAQARFSMAQYGVVTPLPDGLLNGEYSIEIHPITGAIKRIGN